MYIIKSKLTNFYIPLLKLLLSGHIYNATSYRVLSHTHTHTLEYHHNHHHLLSFWPVLVTRIKTVPSISWSDVPGVIYPSVHTDKAALGFSYQAFFPNILAITFDNTLLLCRCLFFCNIFITIRHSVSCDCAFVPSRFVSFVSLFTVNIPAMIFFIHAWIWQLLGTEF
jgi:hypothetical protein